MAQARGTELKVGLFDESTYKTDPGAPDGMLLHLVSFGVRATKGLVNSETKNTNRSRAKPIQGNADVAGNMVAELAAEWVGKLLKHSLGGVSTSGANPYTHDITIANSLPVGMVLDRDIGGITGNRWEKFNGCRVGAMELNFGAVGFPTLTWEIRGAKSTPGASALDATLTDHGHTPFSAFEASILEGGGAIGVVTAGRIRIENDLDDDTFAVGGGGERASLPEGFATISGEVTVLLQDDTLLNKGKDFTQSSLQVTFSRGTGAGSAGNESIVFLVEQTVYERTSPVVEGPGGIRATLPFLGFRSGANNGLKITLKNAVATL